MRKYLLFHAHLNPRTCAFFGAARRSPLLQHSDRRFGSPSLQLRFLGERIDEANLTNSDASMLYPCLCSTTH